MRQVRLHYVKIAALLCALCAGVGAQAQTGAAPAEQPPVKGFTPPAEPVKGFIPPNAASGTVIDSIAVVVNDEVITRNELAGRIKSITTRIKEQNGAMPPETDLQRQVLELMIVERAQMQLAKEMGMRVDDRQLDRAISGIAAQNKLSVQEFRNQIEKGGVTFASFRDGIREELMMERLREHEVDNKVLVTETEVDSFIASEDAAAKEQVDMKLAQIMIRIPDNASAEQIAARRARVDDVSRQLRTGADFAKLAATYSDAGDALKGGELGWQNPNRLPPVFAQALGELKPGQATLPIKTPTGFFILKMSEKRSVAEGKEQALVQQSRARHILIKVNPTMTANDAKRKLLDIKERLDNKAATFEELARLFSVDSSAAKGGDLGWLSQGDTLPEFETAMNALKVGELSGIVETPYGYHLIEVVERKSEDASKERQRTQARQAVRARKIAEASEDWQRQVRDRAYVEFRVEDK